jgi:hypothetical protein
LYYVTIPLVFIRYFHFECIEEAQTSFRATILFLIENINGDFKKN